jgi:transposase
MRYYVGLDVSDTSTNICVINESGAITFETVSGTDPHAILASLNSLNISIEKIGMETGAKSNWLHLTLSPYYEVICYDACKMSKLISMKINKTDKNDARVIAEVVRVDCLTHALNLEVYVKTPQSQEIISLVRVRESISRRLIQIYNQVRGIYKTHGDELPPTKPEHFTKVVLESLDKLPSLVAFSIKGLILPYDATLQSLNQMTQKIEELAEQDAKAHQLMTIPEVGPITSLYFAAIIDDPKRFLKAQSSGSYFGLTPTQYSSGQQEHQGSISKRGDPLMRKLLAGVAQRLMRTVAKSNALKKWGQKKEKKLGKGKATVALARHLSVIMLAMLMKETFYIEPDSPPPQRGVVFTIEELNSITKLAQKTGTIELKSIKQLKKLADTIKVKI